MRENVSFEFVGSVELFGAAHMSPATESTDIIKHVHMTRCFSAHPSPRSPEGTLVLLEGFVDQHVSLHFVLPVERGLTDGAFIRLLSCKTTPSQ